MEWVDNVLQIAGFVLLVLGGWSVADSLARMARAMETERPRA